MRVAVRAAVLLSFVSIAPIAHGQAGVQTPAGYPGVGEPVRISMVSTGAEPRKALRYVVAKDYKGHMNMDMAMSMAMMGQSMDLPTMRIGADMSVASISATGDITYSMAFTGMEVLNSPDPSMAAVLAPLNADLKNIAGTATMTNRGLTRETKIDVSKVSDPMLTQMMDSVNSSLNNISMPFPEEAVGIGAKWEVRQTIASSGITMFQKVLCELTGYDGKTATLKVTMEQTAPSQSMKNPALPPGMDVTLESMTGSGAGTTAAALDALVPVSELLMKSSMTMAMAGQKMETETTIKVQVSPVKK